MNVFSSTSIKEAPPRLQQAMESVAGRVEELMKSRAKEDPAPPFRKRVTPSLYSRIYSSDGKEARNKRAQQRAARTTGINKLGEDEYRKLLQGIDLMTHTPVNIEELINKRMKEIEQRLAAEQQEKEASERRQTRSQTDKPGTSAATDTGTEPVQRASQRKQKADDTDDTSRSRTQTGSKRPKQKSTTEPKRESGGKRPKADDTDDTSRSRTGGKQPKQKKTSAIPILMDDDDDDVIITDDKTRHRDYEPPLDDDDDDNYPIDDDDDDDFQEPIPRARKIVVKHNKLSRKKRKSMTDQQIEKSTKSKKDDDDDETISLFQRIVGPDFEVRASREFEDNTKDKCGNPVEAAGFHATMKMLALELKKAVNKGEVIEQTYVDVVRSTIEVTKAMKYPGATLVELNDILASIKDLKCNAWRKYLKGATIMKPEDIVVDDEAPENEDDLVIQGPTEAAAEAIHKLPKLLLADTKRQLKNLFEHMMQAHQHATEASKCLKELHEALPLDVFLRIADSAVRPLVILHIPKTEEVIQKLKKTAVERTRPKPVSGSTNVKDVMIWRNLPQCGDWTTEEEYRPRKMIACIIHKYIRDVMFKEATPTQVVVDEFNLPKTTIH